MGAVEGEGDGRQITAGHPKRYRDRGPKDKPQDKPQEIKVARAMAHASADGSARLPAILGPVPRPELGMRAAHPLPANETAAEPLQKLSCPRSSAVSGSGLGASACPRPWPRSGGCARGSR